MSKASEAKQRSRRRVQGQRIMRAKRRIRRQRDMNVRTALRNSKRKKVPEYVRIVSYTPDGDIRITRYTREMWEMLLYKKRGVLMGADFGMVSSYGTS